MLLGFGPRPGAGAQVIDYGHGQQRDDSQDDGPRGFRFVVSFVVTCLHINKFLSIGVLFACV